MIRKLLFSATLALGLAASGVWAQDLDTSRTLSEAINDEDGPAVDTALVFTNLANTEAKIGMKAWNAKGEALAKGEITVPPNGLVYVFASRLANHAGVDAFVGKVEARGTGHVTGSTVLLGGPLTDLDAINRVYRIGANVSANDALSARPRLASRISFPLVLTY